ncbi:hypothetical protein B0570_000808 [Salmonella enterica subsp. enterica serovar Benue]|uniref:Uncharacterized protein n=2 Tax=Salmonella enterica TaxID=28901 RepID=A0A701YVV6_SALER|nr:hypothetical protein [Salmonella enterica]EBW3211058.1 hypothetical protein [Salmonella enterica subsp. enterica serovar Remiremont]EDR3558588.1 hypothetical protein [Salmonella enterica subsp. enterica serovar Benue]HAC6565232.1 hypothetical protein [Salmonella enterica subsp. indica]HCM1935257.1 hypothetical protein [Salmonella enterica subsp. indica serovar 6,7:z41:1,7]EKE2599414.1 hypothetical protein [Salmonella enterica]
MNIIDIVKDSWLFDEHFKGITGPLIVAISVWSVRSIRQLFFPFFWIFRNNLSSGFLKLSVDDKIDALKIIDEYRECDGKYDVLMKELKLKQYGLFYPLSILQTLFSYIHDENIRMNSTGFLSFLDCNQIFDYDRHTMATHSSKKIILHLIVYAAFMAFLIYYVLGVFKLIGSLYHAPENFINIMTLLAMLAIVIIIFRIVYIILENSISFIWAIKFSKKLKQYSFSMKRKKLLEKYRITPKPSDRDS